MVEKEQLDKFRDQLSRTQQEIESVLERDSEQLRQQLGAGGAAEKHVDFNHPADMVGGDPDYDKELKLLAREREELAAIDRAFKRMEEGSYGFCEDCGREISLQRLKAVPYTSHCLECQEIVDQQQLKAQRSGIRR